MAATIAYYRVIVKQYIDKTAYIEYNTSMQFLTTFGVTLAVLFAVTYGIGAVPYYVDGSEPVVSVMSEAIPAPKINLSEYGFTSSRTVALADVPQLGDEEATLTNEGVVSTPVQITINAIGLDFAIENPTSTNVDVLDEALLDGPVRYPGSGLLGENGNIFVFAHSSHLPVVHNQMFRAFNRINELIEGDTIKVFGEDGRQHIYRVSSVRLTDANEELVDLSPNNGRRLTLSTCNTFGAKTSRYVVEAEFIAEI